LFQRFVTLWDSNSQNENLLKSVGIHFYIVLHTSENVFDSCDILLAHSFCYVLILVANPMLGLWHIICLSKQDSFQTSTHTCVLTKPDSKPSKAKEVKKNEHVSIDKIRFENH
jgi:hypothetical protein